MYRKSLKKLEKAQRKIAYIANIVTGMPSNPRLGTHKTINGFDTRIIVIGGELTVF